MKKKMIYVAAALVLGAVTVFNVKTVLDANRTYDLTMTSIDALSENGGGGNESGESPDQESNNEGSGIFFYEHREGKPAKCRIYRHVHISGSVQYSEDGSSLGLGWKATQVTGLIETCPKDGDGCTVYSCQTTN